MYFYLIKFSRFFICFTLNLKLNNIQKFAFFSFDIPVPILMVSHVEENTNPTIGEADADQTNEYNNSLIFGNDSSNILETQNVGKIIDPSRILPDIMDDKENMIQDTQVDVSDNGVRTRGNLAGHLEEQGDEKHVQLEDYVDDTQVILHLERVLGDTGFTGPTNDTQVVKYLDGDTQVVSGDTQAVATDTQVVGTDTQVIVADDTQILDRQTNETQINDNPHKPTTVEEDVTNADITREDITREDITREDIAREDIAREDIARDHIPADMKDNEVQHHNFINDTQKVEPKDNSSEKEFLTFSQTDTSKSGFHSSDKSNQHPSTSPSAYMTKSMLQIPGTVEKRGPETQVIQSQETPKQDSIDANVDRMELIDTDDEDMGGVVYDDSILAHKMKFQHMHLSDDSSPSKVPQVIRSPPPSIFKSHKFEDGEDEEEISAPTHKRQKVNVVESQSQSQSQFSQVVSEQQSQPGKPASLEPLRISQPISQSSNHILRHETTHALTSNDIVSKRSVWAIHKFKLYPGLVLSVGAESLEVLFEEGSFSIVNKDLFPMDIRIGDTIRLKGTSMAYEITGLHQDNLMSQDNICCIRGYNQVSIKRKVKTKKASRTVNEKCENVSKIFMEMEDWYEHQQLFTILTDTNLLSEDGLTSMINENMKTPTRNRHTQDIKPDLRSSPRALSRVKGMGAEGVLADGLFCMTSVNDNDKTKLTKIIYSNGGSIVDDGFIQLFDYCNENKLSLKIKDDETSTYKFVALIANGVARSSKYLQAVALGWPILSENFIFDVCNGLVDFDSWPAYLLGAGHSNIIGGIKSLNIFRYQQKYYEGCTIDKQIDLNSNILEGIVIMGLESLVNQKEIITLEFIFHAFGAKDFVMKPSTAELMKYIKNNKLRSEQVVIYNNTKSLKGLEKYKTINWEWMVQCCISNHAWDL